MARVVPFASWSGLFHGSNAGRGGLHRTSASSTYSYIAANSRSSSCSDRAADVPKWSQSSSDTPQHWREAGVAARGLPAPPQDVDLVDTRAAGTLLPRKLASMAFASAQYTLDAFGNEVGRGTAVALAEALVPQCHVCT